MELGFFFPACLLLLVTVTSVRCITCPDVVERRIAGGDTCTKNVGYYVNDAHSSTFHPGPGIVIIPGIDCFTEGERGFIHTYWDEWCKVTVRVKAVCSWHPNHCWPGDCSDNLAANCQCRDGFEMTGSSESGRRCRWNNEPDLNTCRVSMISSAGEDVRSTHIGGKTDCSSQRDEYMNIQPAQLYFVVKANFDKPLGVPVAYVSESKAGVVGAEIKAVKFALDGSESPVLQQSLHTAPHCQHTVSASSPVIGQELHDCEGTLDLPQDQVSLQDGQRICAVMKATAGGYYKMQDYNGNYMSTQYFPETESSKSVCFTYDESKPVHCTQTGGQCSNEPLRPSTRLLRIPEVEVNVNGWTDPWPQGGNSMSASGIVKFRLEVHGVHVGNASLSVQHEALTDLTKEWTASNDSQQVGGPYDVPVTLPEAKTAQLYALILEVHDTAGNVAYGRRLVLLDNSSSVELNPSSSVSVVHADPESNKRWQTDLSKPLCVDYSGRFYNTDMYHNNFLMTVTADHRLDSSGQYDQTSGLLPVSGTKNVNGVTKFEISWSRDSSPRSAFTEVNDVLAETECLSQPLQDGESYDMWVRATDIMGNTQEDSVHVSIDSTGPEVDVGGLRGRWNREGLYVHRSTDLSTMTLVVTAADPHSGLRTIQWTLATQPSANDVGEGAVKVQRLENVTSCDGLYDCYCPSVGDCEIHRYLLTFTNLIHQNTHQGDHHRKYYITLTVTNTARLVTTSTVTILLDESPPTVGVVWEGLSEDGQAEMDFTSSPVAHVRWHGYQDQESGIMLYRVVLAERCMTDQEMDNTTNATEVENVDRTSFTFPTEGLYYISVVGYNAALEPSKVACSDGITYDTTPPMLRNVSITHARVGQMLGCTQRDQTWLINTNWTRVALFNTTACRHVCSAIPPPQDVGHLPLSSGHVLSQELSDHYCQALPTMTEDSTVVLPSDYVLITWEGVDGESQVEDYFLGMGTDRTSSSAPDLLPFTTTHGHRSYHARHVGLGHGDTFFTFLKVLNKAGLSVTLTLGPVLIDETAPEVTQPLDAVLEEGHLLVAWQKDVFTDSEQPDGVELQVTFRVGHSGGFVTPFLTLPESSLTQCRKDNITGCARYPIQSLYANDSEDSRSFFFQLHVTNAAGHMTTVNTSSVSLPARYPPRHALIKDVIKTVAAAPSSTSQPPTTTLSMPDASSVHPSTGDHSLEMSFPTSASPQTTQESTEAFDHRFTSAQFSDDVDVIFQQEEICVAWAGFYHEEEVAVTAGVGTSVNQDDVIRFHSTDHNNHVCHNVSSLPIYTKIFSVVKATSSGGTSIFSSDGFVVIPKADPENRIQVFNGKGCHRNSIIGNQVIDQSVKTSTLSNDLISPIHVGDAIFIQTSPFVPNITFQNAVLIQTTLTGYQLIAVTPNITATFPDSLTSNISLQIQHCQKESPVLSLSASRIASTWEMTGPWKPFVKYLQAEFLDLTCLANSPQKNEYVHQQCTVQKDKVSASATEMNHFSDKVFGSHSYASSISPCFDDGCLPSVTSNTAFYTSIDAMRVTFDEATILDVTTDELTIYAEASVGQETRALTDSSSCVYQWMVKSGTSGSNSIWNWKVQQSSNCSRIEMEEQVPHTKNGRGKLHLCLKSIYPWRSPYPECVQLTRSLSSNKFEPFHVIELSRRVYRQTDLTPYLYSQQLGSSLHDLSDLDLDIATSDVKLSALLTYSRDLDVTWFLMRNRRVPLSENCAEDADCVMSVRSIGKVVLPHHLYTLQSGLTYYICALASELKGQGSHAVCGDGVIIDDATPTAGSVSIVGSEGGYLADGGHMLVSWSGFSDVETQGPVPSDISTLNYSVGLGSYPGAQDIAPFVPVGQRTTWMFVDIRLASGVTLIATVRAQDRVGHVTEAWSNQVIVDNTPPVIGRVAAGTVTRENFVSGHELPVHWENVRDSESGIRDIKVGVAEVGGQDSVTEFQTGEGSSTILTDTSSLTDGHSYVVLLKVTNRAGLTALQSSAAFVIDSTPPSQGHVWHTESDTVTASGYSTQVGVLHAKWTGFTDPHTGLDFFRVGIGSSPGQTDVFPFAYVGRQTSYTWKHDFDQGIKYYVIVQACNRAGLCRVTSSDGVIFDDSPPTSGHVTVGPYGHHSNYLGHNSSIPAQWTGFSDLQTGIQHFIWCVGRHPGQCDVIPSTHTMLARAAHKADVSFPVATPLYVTVRAVNGADLETASVSDTFMVDPTPPEVVIKPYFRSAHGNTPAIHQWDRSVLHLVWKFRDPDSSVVSHTVNVRSQLTGHLVVDPIVLGAENQLTLTLDEKSLLKDGDTHWVSVTACNAAHLCLTSISDFILIDSTPPTTGTFMSPLSWSWQNASSDDDVMTMVDVEWNGFGDEESGVTDYELMVGRTYNGEELSKGRMLVRHSNTTHTQHLRLEIGEKLSSGDVIHMAVLALNALRLPSPLVRMEFICLQDNVNGTSGTLTLVRHSCEASYCTQECTCAARSQVCKGHVSPCVELSASDPALSDVLVFPVINALRLFNSTATNHEYTPVVSSPTYSTSAKCLEGSWNLSHPVSMANVSRFEYSFSLASMSAGEGVFDPKTEQVWHDVGRHVMGIHCLPGKRTLASGQSYVLHVREWLSRDSHVTFVSPPIMVDHSPPQVRRGKAVIDSDVTCSKDIDYITAENSDVTACWNGVFTDSQSGVVLYEIWLGTSPMDYDHHNVTEVGLNTTWTFPTANLHPGTRYYVTVRAWNAAGLQTTLISDGFLVDVSPPRPGVVFTSGSYRNRHAQSSVTSVLASWHGFEDKHSGVRSYHVGLYETDNRTVPVVPFFNVGLKTEVLLQNLVMQHGHSYTVGVKALDAAGWESDVIHSAALLIDSTPPEGVMCNASQLVVDTALTPTPTSSPLLYAYQADVKTHVTEIGEIMSVEVRAEGMDSSAIGYLQLAELKMPLYFRFSPSGVATAHHSFLSPYKGDQAMTVFVEAAAQSSLTAKVYRCEHAAPSSQSAVTIQQISQNTVSICSHVRDQDSGLKSVMIGVGTTEGGLQVQHWTHVGYSGHVNVGVNVQHATPLYATVAAENQAGEWSRFASRQITFDRTGPSVSEVTLSLQYEEQGNVTEVWAEGRWTAEDSESGLAYCTCHLDGHDTINSSIRQPTNDVKEAQCQWNLSPPRHGSKVTAVVTCYNAVYLHTSVTSSPRMVLLRSPDLKMVTLGSFSNNALMSPYSHASPQFRSSNSSLQFFWHGIQDPTVAELSIRFLKESRPLTGWLPLDVYNTEAMLDSSTGAAQTTNITAQLKAGNERQMTSEISASVLLDDSKPLLTGTAPTGSHVGEDLSVDWHQVFHTSRDVIYSVYAGSEHGNGDVINHVTTEKTHLTVHYGRWLSRIHVNIQAVHDNGMSASYVGIIEM